MDASKNELNNRSAGPECPPSALAGRTGDTPEMSKRHTMSHPPPHIPGLEDAPGKDGARTYGSDAASGKATPTGDQQSTPEKKDRKRRSSRSSGSQSSLSSEEGNFEPADAKAKRPVGGVAVLPMAALKKATQKRAEKMA